MGTLSTAPAKTSVHYRLECVGTGELFEDAPSPVTGHLPLTDPSGASSSLLRATYDETSFTVGPATDGLFRFRSWLPVKTMLSGSPAPVSYHAAGFGDALGLSRLQVVFSGFWPQRGAAMRTGTFKETEAFSVFARRGPDAREHLVIASAGNTARAFLHVASLYGFPVVVVVPEANLPNIWTPGPRGQSTILVAAGDGADYADAIKLAALLSDSDGFEAEGGARNVARRDGMGTTFLAGTHALGEIPQHYVQAVGSGTGAIAAWEANIRLLGSSASSSPRCRLHLAQNAPFQVLVDSWNQRSRSLVELKEDVAKAQVSEINAKVLANRAPPYSVEGGLFDALTDTNGQMYAVSNEEADAAAALFEETEGIDVSPAAAVACAALRRAVDMGEIGHDETVLLNITGGGWKEIRREKMAHPAIPDIVAGRSEWTQAGITARVNETIATKANS